MAVSMGVFGGPPSWIPQVGDRIRWVKKVAHHGEVGREATVLKVEMDRNGTGEILVYLDSCTCGETDHHRVSDAPLAWGWKSYWTCFEHVGQAITKEEEAKALPLPSPDDVARFFGVKK